MIRTLLGIRLRSALDNLRGGKSKNGSGRGRMILLTVAYLYVIVVFGGIFSLEACIAAPVLIAAGLDWFYFAMFTVIAFAIVFVLSIFETKSQLFECKDNELLLSMPIKPSQIILSRIFTVLVFNYLETLLVMIPALVFYIVYGGSLYGIIGGTLVTLLLPLLSTSLSSGIGYLIAIFSRRFKNNSFLTVAVALVFLLLYFWGYSALLGNAGEGETPDFVALGNSLSGMRFIGEASLLHPVFTTLFTLITIGISLFAYYVITRNYLSIVTAKASQSKKKYDPVANRSRSSFIALAKKEFSMFFSSANYMLNSAIGVIFTVVLSVAILINKDSIFSVMDMLGAQLGLDLSEAFPTLLCALLVMVSSLNLISVSALSLEGKSFWILRTMPISAETYLMAKTVPAVAVPIVPNLIAAVVLAITVNADLASAILMIIVVAAATVASALLGTVINATFPKFDFENEAQVTKQSMAMFIGMLLTTLYGFLNLLVAFLFTVLLHNALLGQIVMLVLALALSAAMASLIYGPIKKKYNSYQV